MGYTDYYLTEKFRKETGRSISTYIRDVKMAQARVLLDTTDLSVAEIADRLAFNTPNYFIQSFRSVMGYPPDTGNADRRKPAGIGTQNRIDEGKGYAYHISDRNNKSCCMGQKWLGTGPFPWSRPYSGENGKSVHVRRNV
ncbi:MAG: helix-turn-helix transcriptional regulator [Clostridia bacterium]|nr:helix-turn-helix transcriptional regulator [Clostridia bacterium]